MAGLAAWWRKNVIEPVHSFRIPLPRPARHAMTLVYIFAPVVGGYYVMEYTNGVRDANLRDGDVLREATSDPRSKVHVQHQKRQLAEMLDAHKHGPPGGGGGLAP